MGAYEKMRGWTKILLGLSVVLIVLAGCSTESAMSPTGGDQVVSQTSDMPAEGTGSFSLAAGDALGQIVFATAPTTEDMVATADD